MRRWVITIALCVVAVVLSAALLRYAESHNFTHEDYSVTRSIPDEPILTTGWSVMDFVCIKESTCDRAMAVVRGLYARQGIPFLVAFLGGFVLPPLLIIGAVAYQARKRWLNVVALCSAALILSLTMLDFTIDYIRFYSGPAGTDIQQRISAEAIWTTRIESNTDWCMVGPLSNKCDFARVNGVFPRRGVPRNVAIAGGMAAPLGLLICAFLVMIWRRQREDGRTKQTTASIQ